MMRLGLNPCQSGPLMSKVDTSAASTEVDDRVKMNQVVRRFVNSALEFVLKLPKKVTLYRFVLFIGSKFLSIANLIDLFLLAFL